MSNSAAVAILGLGLFGMVAALALYVLYVIGCWKVFTKAGEAGWKSLIPIYNTFVSYRIAGQTTLFIPFIILVIVQNLIPGGENASTTMILLRSAVAVALVIVEYIKSKKLAAAFGHSVAFGVGLAFLPYIYNIILGFDSSEYTKPENL